MTVQMQNKDDGIQSRSDRQLPAVPDPRLLDADSLTDFDVAWIETLLRELSRQGASDTVRLDQLDIWESWKAFIEPDTDGDSERDDDRSAGDQQARPKPGRPSETQTFDDVQDHDPNSPEQNDFRTMRLQDRRRSLKQIIANASKNQSRAQVEEDLFAALAEMLATYDESLLKRALDTLKRTGRDAPDSLTNAVCRLATHPEMSVRRRAVYVLGETSETELALPVLIQALGDPRYPVRRNAAIALGKLGDRRAVTALTPALQDASKRVRREAVRVLGELGDERAVEPLIASLQDSDEIVRQVSSEALVSQFPQQALEPLGVALVDGDETVRQAAAEALEQLGDERAVNALRTALDDGDADVRLAAAEALERLEDKQAAQSVTSTHDEYSAAARQTPVAPVVRLVNTQTLESLISGLKNDDPQVRSAAAAQLGRLGDARAVEPLIDLLGDQHLSVREAAGKALQDLGELATEPLIVALNNRKGTVQRKAAQVLADTADVRTQETFIAALEYPDGAVRWDAVRALRSIDTPQAWEAVKEYRARQQRRARTKRILVRVLLPGLALAAIVVVLVWMVGQQLG